MNHFINWFRDTGPATLGILVPITAIIMGVVFAITKAITHHRERMAMIERGIHPDAPRPR
jgi:hypothetical protein